MKKWLKRIAISLAALVALLVLATIGFMQFPQFGRNPKGEALDRVKASEHYREGSFQNLIETPQLAEGESMGKLLWNFLFGKKQKRRVPKGPIPTAKSDLLGLGPAEDVMVWFGHSSYFMQLDGVRVLVDPVFSGSASPLPGSVKAFPGTDVYTVEDLPAIDLLLISHDHYDHLDYKTIKQLRGKVGQVVCGLGVGSHFRRWGYKDSMLHELDWGHHIALSDELKVYAQPARHFSGRSLNNNQTLWCSYVLKTTSYTLYVGGDSGYGPHFQAIGEQFGPFDLAMLECGQYDPAWPYIHAMPEEVAQAAQDLRAQRFFPVHNGKFPLANHAWDDPLLRVAAANGGQIPMVTPIIGQKVSLAETSQRFDAWWEAVASEEGN